MLIVASMVLNINLSSAQIDALPSRLVCTDNSSKENIFFRPITVNGQTACHTDGDCNGSCGINPVCYWKCESNFCMYQTRATWAALSNREVGIPDAPIDAWGIYDAHWKLKTTLPPRQRFVMHVSSFSVSLACLCVCLCIMHALLLVAMWFSRKLSFCSSSPYE